MAYREFPSENKSSGGWKGMFSAFQFYNYRLWFLGQVVSLVGTWMQSTAQGYLIYQLTNSPVYLGLVGFFGGVFLRGIRHVPRALGRASIGSCT